MSPRPADPNVRVALIEAAARLLATEGPAALTTRRLAEEVGTSTMAVYTHFRGMPELRGAVRREGFARLARHLDSVRRERDPVGELTALGGAYMTNALTNPALYRAMFMETPLDAGDAEVGLDTFERLVAGVKRCMDEGRFPRCTDERGAAAQLWAMTHGAVTLVLAGMLDVAQAAEIVTESGISLFVGFGDDRARASRSVRRAAKRLAAAAGISLPGTSAARA